MMKRGLSRRALASAVGVTHPTVAKWINGAVPRSNELYRLAQFFDMPINEVFAAAALSELMQNPSGLILEVAPSRLPAVRKFGSAPQSGQNPPLTDVTESDKNPPMTMQALLQRLRRATSKRGMKTRLAKVMGVPLANVSQWLSGVREPSGETTLRLLRWLQLHERKTNPTDTK